MIFTQGEATALVASARLVYRDAADACSERTVRPLGCFYWGNVWTLSAWCELRNDFRGFRVDRMEALEVLSRHFCDEPGKTLAEMLRRVQVEGISLQSR